MTRAAFTKLFLVLASTPLLIGCGLVDTIADSITGPDKSDIVYRVTGTAAKVSVRYETESGTSEASSTALPWSFTRKAERDDALYVSAQIVEGDGTVTAAIYRGENLLNSATSTGAGATATASANLD